MESFRKAYGALKDSTKVGLAKVNSEFKDLDIAIVKATNHVEYPPKERHVRRIFWATSVSRPRADVGYCIHALSRRLAKTRNWIVAIKTLIVIHRTLREGDPTFREELLNYSHRGQIFQLANFKDDSSPLAWDCSAWVRTYALFLEERLECFRSIKFDIEAERLTKATGASSRVLTLAPSRARVLTGPELLDNLPALQVLLFRLVCCQPEGSACHNFLIQYALALILKESFKIYCAINDGIINLVDMFFDMPRHDAVKALNIYKKAGKQAENLADFYDFCRGLDLARTFQFPILRQPPPSFLATMEEYIKEAPQVGSMSTKRLEYNGDATEEPQKEVSEETEPVAEVQREEEEEVDKPIVEELDDKPIVEEPPMISTDEPADLLGLSEINPQAAAIEESNALALAIIQPGNEYPSNDLSLADIGKTSGWELALVTTPSNHTSKPQDRKLAGGFDKFLLDSLYEDDASRRQLQLQHAGYNSGYGYETAAPNPFNHHDPFAVSNAIAPPTNVQMAMLSQQEQMLHQQQQNMMMMVAPHQQYPNQYSQQMPSYGANTAANPFGDPFNYPQSPMPPQGNHTLI